MKKRIFALVTALVLALGLAVTAGADEPVTELWRKNVDDGRYWQTDKPYHLVAGSYKLMEDIELTQALTIDAGAVEIDLNGYTLSLKSGAQDSVICVTGSGTLFLEDNSPAGTGKITGGTGYKEDNASSSVGGGIRLLNGGTVNMNGGTITDCTASFGGGVYAGANSSFHMYGGTITGCTATSGGGICVEGGSLDMYEGTVSGCTATNGGAVYLKDQTTVLYSRGGMISGTVYVGQGCTITPNDMAHKFNQQTVFDGTVTVNGVVAGGVYSGQVSKATVEAAEKVFLMNGIFWHDRNGDSQIGIGFASEAEMYGTTPYIVNYNFDANILYKRCTVLVARFDASPSEDSAAQTRESVKDDKSDVQDIYLAAPDAPTRAGYTFLGWYTAPVGGTKWDFDADALSQNQLAEGVTLYARWESDHQHTRRQNTAAATPEAPTADADTVTSAKTFDAGVAVYGVMAVVSVLGMGYVGKKRV